MSAEDRSKIEEQPVADETADDIINEEGGDANGEAKKKKKKKKPVPIVPGQDNSVFRRVGDWKEGPSRQTFPIPTVRLREAFPSNEYNFGEIHEYIGTNAFRTTSEEKRDIERSLFVDYNAIRLAAECHRQVRRFAQSYIRPGMELVDICQRLENKGLELLGAKGLESGRAFPTGCSLNHVAAHYTPNYGDHTQLTQNDIMKLDFGVHVGGRLIDCAFTVAFDPMYDNIIEATQEGTNAGIKAAGIDARFSEIGETIQEVIESYEMTDKNGKVLKIRAIKNLNGHTIDKYKVHAGKSLPIVKNDLTDKMEEGEVYAIETFASTGRAQVWEDGECSHYMRNYEQYDIGAPLPKFKNAGAASLLQAIDKNFGTLAWCRRWLDDCGQDKHLMALKALVDAEVINTYPPLVDIKGAYTSQMEHTVLLRPTCKEVLSRGDDY